MCWGQPVSSCVAIKASWRGGCRSCQGIWRCVSVHAVETQAPSFGPRRFAAECSGAPCHTSTPTNWAIAIIIPLSLFSNPSSQLSHDHVLCISQTKLTLLCPAMDLGSLRHSCPRTYLLLAHTKEVAHGFQLQGTIFPLVAQPIPRGRKRFGKMPIQGVSAYQPTLMLVGYKALGPSCIANRVHAGLAPSHRSAKEPSSPGLA